MIDEKNIILALGNKEFNNSLIEVKNYFNFSLKTVETLEEAKSLDYYQGLIIHEDALHDKKLVMLIKNNQINQIIFHKSKKMKGFENIEKLFIPASINQINELVVNNIIKKKFKINSSLKINNYTLNKNSRKLTKDNLSLELTEKEIELIELLKSKAFIKKNEILSIIWKYSSDADTHTVETHIYRLRKKIKEIFDDEVFIKSEKRGYTI